MTNQELFQQFTIHAPVDTELTLRVFGDHDVDLTNDSVRRAFFAVQALLRVEYATAMMQEYDKRIHRKEAL